MRGLRYHKGDYKKVIEMATIRHLIGVVMRQTTYTFEEAFNKLREHQRRTSECNQRIYGHIRQ